MFTLPKNIIPKWLKFWLGILIGVILFYIAVRNVEFKKIFGIIKSSLLLPIFCSLLLRIVALWLRSIRWLKILKPLKKIPLITGFRIISITEMYNHLLPARGGEVIRVILISKREKISEGVSVGSIIVEKIFDLSVVLIFLFSVSFFITFPELIEKSIRWGTAGFIFFLSLLYIFIRKYNFTSENSIISRFIQQLHQGLNLIKNLGQFLNILIYTLIFWFVSSFALYLIFVGLNIRILWYVAVITIAVNALGTIIPAAPGYIGTSEFLFVITLGIFMVDKSSALSSAFVAHGLQLIVVAFFGLLSHFYENIRFRPFEPSQVT